MKKIVLTMAALLTMMTAVAQQDDNNERKAPKKPTPEEMTNRLAEQLKLTDKQKTKVLALNKEYEDVIGGPGMGMGGRRMGPRPDGPRPDGQTGATAQPSQQRERPQLTDAQRKEMQQRMEKRQEYDAKLKKILTDEQLQEYQKMHQHRGGRGGHGGPRPHGPMMNPEN